VFVSPVSIVLGVSTSIRVKKLVIFYISDYVIRAVQVAWICLRVWPNVWSVATISVVKVGLWEGCSSFRTTRSVYV